MLYCQKHNFREYKPHPHTQHFASTEADVFWVSPASAETF